MVDLFFATSGNEVLGKMQGGKEDLHSFIKCDATHNKGGGGRPKKE